MFAQFTQVDPKSEMKIVFLFLRYCRLSYTWDINNALVFDCRYGVTSYIFTEVEGSIYVATLFIGLSLSSFLNGEFFLPIGDLASIILPLA